MPMAIISVMLTNNIYVGKSQYSKKCKKKTFIDNKYPKKTNIHTSNGCEPNTIEAKPLHMQYTI